MGSIDKALPHAGFYPDSQTMFDAAKIRIISLHSKQISIYFIFFLEIFLSFKKRCDGVAQIRNINSSDESDELSIRKPCGNEIFVQTKRVIMSPMMTQKMTQKNSQMS